MTIPQMLKIFIYINLAIAAACAMVVSVDIAFSNPPFHVKKGWE